MPGRTVRRRLIPAVAVLLLSALILALTIGEKPVDVDLLVLLGVSLVVLLGLILWTAGSLDNADVARGRLAAIVEASNDAIVSKDLDGTITSWNAAAERLYGYRADEALGRPISLLVPPDRGDEHAEALERVGKGEHASYPETVRLTKDGRRIDVSVTISPVLGENGKIVGASTIARDVSERKQAETELRNAEEKFRTLAERLPLVTYRNGLTPDGPPLYVSPQVEHLTGFSPDEWTSDPDLFWKVLHPDDKARVRAETDRARETGRLETEYRMIREDGEVIWVRDVTITIEDDEGQPLYLEGFLLDITEQQRGEADLREAEERYRRLAEHLPLVTYIDRLEPDKPSLYMSPQIEEWTGHPRELWESGREFFRSVLHPDDAERVLNASRNEVDGFSMDYRLIARDGRVVWVRDESMIMRDDEGRPLYAQGFLVDITTQKHAELELRDAERKYRSLAERLPVVTFQTSLDTVAPLRYASPQIEQMLGYSVDDWLTDPELPNRVMYPDDRERWMSELVEAKAKNEPFESEFRVVAKDGRVLWVEDSTVVIRGEDGVPAYRQGYLRDITERKQSEQLVGLQLAIANVLAESQPVEEALSRILAEIGRVFEWNWSAFWAIDSADGALSVTALWHSSGLEAGEFGELSDSIRFERGQGFPGRIWESGQPLWVRDFSAADFPRSAAARQAGLRTCVGCPVAVRNQVIGVLELFSTETKEEDARLVQTLGVVGSQIGQFLERSEAEESLRESEERFRAVFESDAVGITIVDPAGRVISCNPAFAAMLGFEAADLLGADLMSLTHPEDREASRVFRRRIMSGESDHEWLEKRYLAKDGSTVWGRVVAVPIRDSGGATRYTIGLTEDLRERRQLEEELRHAQKMEAVGRLAGGVAHDFNNLLLAIRGYSELALTELDETAGEARTDIERIKEATERAASLTGRLLAFSRKQILQPRPVDLSEIVAEAADLLRRVMGEGVELATNLEAELQPVQLDPLQMEQALLNLVINACDAMGDGGLLTIETANVVWNGAGGEGVSIPPGPYVKLSVSDTGSGMDDATRQRVFEPFFTTKSSGGTGLGLSTVFGFVEQSGGHMLVDSEPGEGATFELYFPPVDSALAPRDVRPAQPDAAGTETILLVEDENIVRRMLKTVLTRAGFTVLEARDGEEALVVAARHPGKIDVMVTDVVMPRLGGVGTAEALRKSRPETRVIYMSGHVRDRGALEEIRATATFIQKPFAPAQLAAKVREVLDGPSSSLGP